MSFLAHTLVELALVSFFGFRQSCYSLVTSSILNLLLPTLISIVCSLCEYISSLVRLRFASLLVLFFSFLFLFFLFYFEAMHGMWRNIWLLAVSLKLVLRSDSCVGSCVDLGPSALCSGVGPKKIFSSPGVTHVQIRDSWWLPTKNLLLKFYPDAQVSFSISSPVC